METMETIKSIDTIKSMDTKKFQETNTAKEKIIKMFNITEELYHDYNEQSDTFIKGYFNGRMNTKTQFYFPYLQDLDPSLSQYLQFGGNDCGVDNFAEFCKEINVDITENRMRFAKEMENTYFLLKKRNYHFYSRDKKLTFTCSSSLEDCMRGHFDCFGVTGEAGRVLNAFEQFCKRGYYRELCWSFRDFV